MLGTGLAGAAARWAVALTFGGVLMAGALARDVADAEASPADALLVMIRMAPAHARPDVDYGDGYAGRAGQAARRRIAEAIARTHRLQMITNWPMPAIGVECYLMRVLPGTEVAAAIEAVSHDPRAEWAQPLQHFAGQSYNDPLYLQQPTASWQLHALHAAATGRNVLIAQIDSGADAEHPDLRGNVRETVNTAHTLFRAEGHGTAVAGILVAHAGNRIGIAGVAPGASLLAVRACWEREHGAARCDSLSLAKGLQIALDRGARVINLSVSGPPDRLLRELLNAAIARGVIVVAAVDAKATDGGFPASSRGVIAVIDLDGALQTAPARQAPLAVPARDVPTTSPGARWAVVSGASFATAEVSGMVALLLELLPAARAGRIEALLRGREESQVDAALSVPMPIDACRSVSLAAGRCVCDCAAGPAYFTLDRR
jgi:subtilisin family serine protease